jgi:hypothetical protein
MKQLLHNAISTRAERLDEALEDLSTKVAAHKLLHRLLTALKPLPETLSPNDSN